MKIDFTFAVHNHQPVGNFDFVIEQNYRESYEPFISALEKHPGMRAALHYTGYLWDYLKTEHPDFIERLHELVERRQVEMLGGAYYEAILTVLPERDAVAQQQLLKREMEQFSGSEVNGMWLAERIWEPSLPTIINRGGYKYTFLDESHFHAAGIPSEDVWGLFRTEDRGETTVIFPIDKTLRYSIPFALPEKAIEILADLRDSGVTLATYGDDGEKFGSWPDTYKWVHEDGWLENFMTLLENSDVVNMLLPREAFAKHVPRSNIYLPCASYEEMGEWTLPAEAQVTLHHLKNDLKTCDLQEKVQPWLRGGFWRQFLAKYEESGRMYRRMLRVSDKVDALKHSKDADVTTIERAAKALHRGQANDAYWHGVFGGVYLPHLRTAVKKELIIAETLADKIVPAGSSEDKYEPQAVVLENANLRLQIHPHQGGGIAAIDDKTAGIDLINTMTRYREPYHARMLEANGTENNEHASIHDRLELKEDGLAEKLAVDTCQRFCFMDRFIKPGFDLEDLQYNRLDETNDFAEGIYTLLDSSADHVTLNRSGQIGSAGLEIVKTFRLDQNPPRISAEYDLTGVPEKSGLLFAPELNLNLLAPDADDRYFLINDEKFPGNNLGNTGDRDNVKTLSLVDEWQGIRLDLQASHSARWVWHPVETISLSEDGIERIYQGSAILPLFELSSLKGASLKITIGIQSWKPVI